jgi:hypothetical protein
LRLRKNSLGKHSTPPLSKHLLSIALGNVEVGVPVEPPPVLPLLSAFLDFFSVSMDIFAVGEGSLLHLIFVFQSLKVWQVPSWNSNFSSSIAGLGISLHPRPTQYQLDHATYRNCLGAYYHHMIDSSLTTPLPHLKSLYYTHMGGLAVSGSHGLREFTELVWRCHSLRLPCWYPTVH